MSQTVKESSGRVFGEPSKGERPILYSSGSQSGQLWKAKRSALWPEVNRDPCSSGSQESRVDWIQFSGETRFPACRRFKLKSLVPIFGRYFEWYSSLLSGDELLSEVSECGSDAAGNDAKDGEDEPCNVDGGGDEHDSVNGVVVYTFLLMLVSIDGTFVMVMLVQGVIL